MHIYSDPANSQNKFWSSRLTNVITNVVERVTENNQETIELDKLQEPKASSQSNITSSEKSALVRPEERELSKDDIPDSQCDISSGQKHTTAEVSG